MRKLLLLLANWALVSPVFAQTTPFLPYRLPSYTAVGLAQQAATDQGMAVGRQNVGLPIYSLSSRLLSVPVGLEYLTGGVKLAAMATDVGLNWSLQAGGAIVRIPFGSTDVYAVTGTTITGVTADQPDIFYFNFLGRKGKFAAFPNGSVYTFRTMPYQLLRIEAEWADEAGVKKIQAFTVEDETGTRYRFAQKEITQMVVNGVAEAPETHAWYLTQIDAADYSDRIIFDYETFTGTAYSVGLTAWRNAPVTSYSTLAAPGLYTSPPPVGGTASACPSVGYSYGQLLNVEVKVALNQGVRLREIAFVNGRMLFIKAAAPRADYASAYDLRKIVLLREFNGPADTLAVWELEYAYFNSSCANDKRLMLKALSRKYTSDAGAPAVLRTRLNYYAENSCLPNRLAFSVDHWGYANTKSANTQFAPGNDAVANRAADTLARWATLAAIRSPLGGVTAYEWELHQAATGPVGGLRLKRVVQQPNGNPSDTANIIREYSYGAGGNGLGHLTGNGALYPTYSRSVYKVLPCTGANRAVEVKLWASSSLTDFLDDAFISYSEVLEKQGVNGRFGQTRYTFTSALDYPDSLVQPSGTVAFSQSWKRALPTGQQVFSMQVPASPQKLSASRVLYQFWQGNGAADSANVRLTPSYTRSLIVRMGTDDYLLSGQARLLSGWVRQVEALDTTYTHDTPPLPVVQRQWTVFHQSNMLPVQTESDMGSGRILGSRISYAEDLYPSLPSTAADTATAALIALKQQGRRGVPVETLSYYRASLSDTQRVVTGSAISVLRCITVTNEYTAAPQTVVVPFRSYGARIGQPLLLHQTFRPVRIVSGVLQPDAAYYYPQLHSGNVISYNPYAQPLTVVDARGVPSSTLWGYRSTLPVATVGNASFDLGTASYAGFEWLQPGTAQLDGWNVGAAGLLTTSGAFTGQNALSGPTGGSTPDAQGRYVLCTRLLPSPDAKATYVLSAWVKRTAPLFLELKAVQPSGADISGVSYSVETTEAPASADWQWVTVKLDLPRVAGTTPPYAGPIALKATFYTTSASPQAFIDDIRLHPLEAAMTATTFLPLVGPSSASNALGIPQFQEYNSLLEAVRVRNHRGELLLQKHTHIQENQ